MSELGQTSQPSVVQLALLEYRMNALENSVKADVSDLRRDIQEEAKYTRESLSKRDAAQITTLVMVILALCGIVAQFTIHFMGKN